MMQRLIRADRSFATLRRALSSTTDARRSKSTHRKARCDLQQPLRRSARCSNVAEIDMAYHQIRMGHAKVRVGLDCQRRIGGGLGETVGEQIGDRKRTVGVIVQRIERTEPQRLQGVFNCPFMLFAVGVRQGAESECQSRIAVQF